MRALLLAALVACGKADEQVVEVLGSSSATDVVKGSITVDGKAVTLGACKPGHSVHPLVELITSAGKLRFEDQQLYWNPVADAPTRGDKLTCDKLDRSWGGGVRLPGDGTSYWRGKLWFRCGAIHGELELDCGNITATERAQLDGKRQDLLDKQHGSPTP
jgi:hypothetical protein